MWKKSFLIIILILVSSFLFLKIFKGKITSDLSQTVTSPSATPLPTLASGKSAQESSSIFVPYWSLGAKSSLAPFNDIFYFGITPSENGIKTQEAGFQNLKNFLLLVDKKQKKFLVLRMTDTKTNLVIFKNQNLKNKIIHDTIDLAQKNGFQGIVLDLELSALPFDSLIKNVNDFVGSFAGKTKTQKMQIFLTLYGDTFYRIRPFDVKNLAGKVDQVMVMAYDFHKARGNPGPNFPLSGRQKYGYDFTQMVTDFTEVVPVQKLNIIFGLFGYDWTVDGSNKATAQANPLTYLEIQKHFLENCQEINCKITKDSLSQETEVSYDDKEGKKHIVWFEDMASVAKKQEYLLKRGINNFSYWAYSYF